MSWSRLITAPVMMFFLPGSIPTIRALDGKWIRVLGVEEDEAVDVEADLDLYLDLDMEVAADDLGLICGTFKLTPSVLIDAWSKCFFILLGSLKYVSHSSSLSIFVLAGSLLNTLLCHSKSVV